MRGDATMADAEAVTSLDGVRRRRPDFDANRVPPNNLEAEESLLGAMLLSPSVIETGLSPADFYRPAHGHIFEAITNLYARGERPDPVTVAEFLSRDGLLEAIGGPATLITLQARTPTIGNAGRYGRIVEEHSVLRRLIRAARD
ncbi:MAG TPA: DnaB-like helicase N-terminal domain-containing protein, partial [Acidimicrobiales bacterium]